MAYRLLPDGTLPTRRVSADTPGRDSTVDIGVDLDGTAHLTYYASDNDGHAKLYGRTWKRSGAVGAARRLVPSSHVVVRATSRTDLRGDTMVTWSRGTPDSYIPVLYGRVWRHDGTLGPVQKLGRVEPADAQGHVPSPAPQLAVDDDGDGVVSWPSEPEVTRQTTWVRRVHRNGSFGPKVLLRDSSRPHALAMTPAGRARLAVTASTEKLLLFTGP